VRASSATAELFEPGRRHAGRPAPGDKDHTKNRGQVSQAAGPPCAALGWLANKALLTAPCWSADHRALPPRPLRADRHAAGGAERHSNRASLTLAQLRPRE
jgi:hypothetical protein